MSVLSILAKVATFRAEAPVSVTIRQAELVGGVIQNDEVIFTGEVTGTEVRGSKVTGKCAPGGSIFERKMPRFLFQSSCNHGLFSVGCGLLKGDWKCTARVNDPGAVGYPFTFVIDTIVGAGAGSAAAVGAGLPVNWFAGGWIEFGTGLLWNRRAILASTAPAAGLVTLTLERDPAPFPAVADAVRLWPGCDLTVAACKGLGNYPNFGGHPYMPLANPTIVQGNQGSGGGKK